MKKLCLLKMLSSELAKNPNSKYLRELHLVLDDKFQHEEVMFSLIHFLESFDLKEQLQAFIDVVPNLMVSARLVDKNYPLPRHE